MSVPQKGTVGSNPTVSAIYLFQWVSSGFNAIPRTLISLETIFLIVCTVSKSFPLILGEVGCKPIC